LMVGLAGEWRLGKLTGEREKHLRLIFDPVTFIAFQPPVQILAPAGLRPVTRSVGVRFNGQFDNENVMRT